MPQNAAAKSGPRDDRVDRLPEALRRRVARPRGGGAQGQRQRHERAARVPGRPPTCASSAIASSLNPPSRQRWLSSGSLRRRRGPHRRSRRSAIEAPRQRGVTIASPLPQRLRVVRRTADAAPPGAGRRARAGRTLDSPRGTTAFTPTSETGTTGTPASSARLKLPRLKRRTIAVRAARALGEDDDARAARIRRAAASRLRRARNGLLRSIGMWPSEPDRPADQRNEATATACRRSGSRPAGGRRRRRCRGRCRGSPRRRRARPGRARWPDTRTSTRRSRSSSAAPRAADAARRLAAAVRRARRRRPRRR